MKEFQSLNDAVRTERSTILRWRVLILEQVVNLQEQAGPVGEEYRRSLFNLKESIIGVLTEIEQHATTMQTVLRDYVAYSPKDANAVDELRVRINGNKVMAHRSASFVSSEISKLLFHRFGMEPQDAYPPTCH